MTTWDNGISLKLSSNVSLILVEDAAGSIITNPSEPKLINIYIIFLILIIILFLFISLIIVIAEIRKVNPELYELKQLRAQYADVLSFAKNITQNFYDEIDDLKRIDPKKITISMRIDRDGSATITRTYELHCPEKPAHMLDIWIEADDESPGFLGHRKLRFRAKDVTKNREMDWIPTQDTLRRKEFSIFFTEMQPGETKKIEIVYTWPGYLNKLLMTESAEIFWSHRAASPDAVADVTYEWLFERGFPQVRAKKRGNISQTATLDIDPRDDGVVAWIYRDPTEMIPGKQYRVSFELLSVVE